jgi:hypothetical protein
MTPEAFKAALQQLGHSPLSFSNIILENDRTVRGWASGELPIPRVVELLLVFATYQPNSWRKIVTAQALLDDEL